MYGVTETMDSSVSNGEDRVCKVILLEKGFPAWYLKECDESHTMPTEKEGGVAWKAAVIAEQKNGEWRSLRADEIEPFEMSFPTPKRIYDKNIGMGHVIKGGKAKLRVGDSVAKLVFFENNGDRVVWENLMPSTYPVKDFNTGMTADKIKPEEERKYKDLLDKEQKRLRIWQGILRYWNDISEEQAIQDNDLYISRRLLLYADQGTGEKEYVLAEKGMVFTTKLKGKYNEAVAMEWDNTIRANIYYSKGIEGIEVAAADQILDKDVEDSQVPF